MTETLFHNDETRWLVFVETEGKVGCRWYPWMTRFDALAVIAVNSAKENPVNPRLFPLLRFGLPQKQLIPSILSRKTIPRDSMPCRL